MAPRPTNTANVSQEVATRAETGVARGRSVAEFLTDPKMKKELQRSAAANFDVDHLMRITLTLLRTNPKLAECSQASLAGAMMTSAQLGLDPGVLGHVYYVPFNNKIKLPGGREVWEKQVQFIPGYKGLLELCRRSNQIASVFAQTVHESDKFEIVYGTEQQLRHVPALKDKGDVVGAYAYAKLKDGTEQYEYMTREEVEAVRARSKSKDNGPWVTDWEEMAKKTVLKRLTKTLPMSLKDQRAMAADEAVINTFDATDIIEGEAFEYPVETGEVVDTQTGEITAAEAPKASKARTKKADPETTEVVQEEAAPEEPAAEDKLAQMSQQAVEDSKPAGFKTPLLGGE